MAKTKVTNLIIIDASGSMGSKIPEVQGGLKELFKGIRADAKKIDSTNIVVDFSGSRDFNVLLNSNKLEDLNDNIAEKYQVRGMTALYDAIGKGMNLIPIKTKNVFISILTDGGENDSKEFGSSTIKDLITKAKEKKWAVTFMGTTEQDVTAAQNLGISKGNTMMFMNSKAGVHEGMAKLSSMRSYYSAGAEMKTRSRGIGGASASFNVDNLVADADDLSKIEALKKPVEKKSEKS